MEVVSHKPPVIVTHRNKRVYVLYALFNQLERSRLVPLLQTLEKKILALKSAKHRAVQRLFDRRSQSDEERVGKVDDVGRGLALEPVEEFLQFLTMDALFALEYGDGELSEKGRVGRYGKARRGFDDEGRIPEAIEQSWCLAEDRHELLKIDAHPAEEDSALADVGLVGESRRVERQQNNVVAQSLELRG